MGGRVLAWIGAGVLILSAAGLAAYFAVVGLGQADKLGSAIGAIVGVAGLGVTVYGLVLTRREAAQQNASKYNVTTPYAKNVAVGDEASIQVYEGKLAEPSPTSRSTGDAPSPVNATPGTHVILESQVEELRTAVAGFDPNGVPAELRQRLASAEAELARFEAGRGDGDTG
jgi:hypothetical protein